MIAWIFRVLAIYVLFAIAQTADAPPVGAQEASRVQFVRVPGRGIQPQVAVDSKGIVHLIYYQGEPTHGDIYYVRSADGSKSFSQALRVNHTPGSAIAMGNIRGAQLAVGKNDRIHVVWNGSAWARPKAPQASAGMLATRMNDERTAFETEQNVIRSAIGLDGGGSVAADHDGNVFVTWHAPAPGQRGEENRRVWVARSRDEGKTFSSEVPAFEESTGACGCCGMRAFATDKGNVYILYRSATERVNRDMYLLRSTDHATTFQGRDVSAWKIAACPMSTAFLTQAPGRVLAAWETNGQVFTGQVGEQTGELLSIRPAAGDSRERKYPVIACNSKGETILAWTEGMGWNRGGAVAWQVYDKNARPLGSTGKMTGVPVWSLVAAFARPDDTFVIVY
jgi:hypothetical protein